MNFNSIEECIFDTAKRFPSKYAIISGAKRVFYSDLADNIKRAAYFYKTNFELNTGDRIIVAADKQIEFIYAYFGAHLAGLTVLPVDSGINNDRLDFIIKQANVRLGVGLKNEGRNIKVIPLSEFSDMSLNEENEIYSIKKDNIADILFTTGTTGVPKGVPLTFGNIVQAAENINTFIKNTEDDIELLALPLSHSFGLGRLRCVFAKGATIVLINGFTNMKKLFRIMGEEKVTGFTMVPASWRYIKKFSGEKIKEFSTQLKYIEMGSAFFSAEEKRELASILPNTRVCMHYGLTEASRSAFMEFHEDDAFLDSVGKASPNTEITIFDEAGKPVSGESEGEICIKGNHVTQGYMSISRENSFYGDYFRTGDWGYKNSQGYIYLVSRYKELINVGGKKVSPIEVEEQLKKINGISDCACIGVPDPSGILGEVVKAFIVKDEKSAIDFEEIKNQMKGKLEDYKLPAIYEWITEIPKTHNGKIQRLSLK